MIMNRLTMLAVTLMASIACFAQGKMATTIESGKQVGDVFDYLELKYKVTNASAGYTVQVIGFADAFEADPTKFDTSEDIDAFNTVTIPHYIGTSTDVAVQVYVQSIADGALNTSDATLAGKVTAITIQYVDNDKTQGIPVSIGENAFASLTSLTTVQSLTPGGVLNGSSVKTIINTLPESAFAASVYKSAALIVPSEYMGKYSSKAAWKNFYIIKDSEGKMLGNVNNDKYVNSTDYQKLYSEIKTAIKNGTTVAYSTYKDINGDNKVNSTDYQLLYGIIKGHIQ